MITKSTLYRQQDLYYSESPRPSGHNAAIVFAPEDYSISSTDIVGRAVAGFGFLRAFARYAEVPEFFGCPVHLKGEELFVEAMRRWGKGQPCHVADVRRGDVLSSIGCLYQPDPLIGGHAWERACHAASWAWSVCGITHTTASTRVMLGIADWAVAPVQPWDAVICTSEAVKSMVVNVLTAQEEYLKVRLGASRQLRPQLPVIPLGVNCEDFQCTDANRTAARNALGLSAQAIAVLFVGRLSYHDKVHPLALYQALEAAAQGREVVLIECGWHAHESIAHAFDEAARLACPSIRIVRLDGRVPEQLQTAWRSADIFCSLSDSIQETFGLTPVEAMAAGLPVVVSDWDGYKDTVRHGIDGFRIPTIMPAAGMGADLAQRHLLAMDDYHLYCGYVGQLVAVDIAATIQVLKQLFDDPGLRRKMGAAGQRHAMEKFDWKKIIPRYQALWAELAAMRKHAAATAKSSGLAAYPVRMDPFRLFASYPTNCLTPQTRLIRERDDAIQWLARLRALDMASFADALFPTHEECETILRQFDTHSILTVADLVSRVKDTRHLWVARGISWMVKMGVLQIAP
jgi:glycosyltransferase involved in cell wall biosynthesis